MRDHWGLSDVSDFLHGFYLVNADIYLALMVKMELVRLTENRNA